MNHSKKKVVPNGKRFRQTSDSIQRKASEPGYTDIRRWQFMAKLACFLAPSEMRLIGAAYDFAKLVHRNEVRDSGRRAFDHPRELAIIMVDELKIRKCKSLLMALLHDVEESLSVAAREDPYIVPQWLWLLEHTFGKKVAIALAQLSKLPKEGYYDRLTNLGSCSAVMTKLTDSLQNGRTLYACPLDKRRKQAKELRDVSIPLAERFITMLPPEDKWRGEYLGKELGKVFERYKHLIRE